MIRNRLTSFPISLLLIVSISVVPWNASQAAWLQQAQVISTKAVLSQDATAPPATTSPENTASSQSKPASGGAKVPAAGSLANEAPPSGSAEESPNEATPPEPPNDESGVDVAGIEGGGAITTAEAVKDEAGAASSEENPNNDLNSALPPEQPSSDLDLPPEPMVGKKSATGKGLLIAGISAAGLGVAMLGTSIAITQCNYNGPLQCKYATQRSLFVPTSLAVMLAGAVLVGAGLGFRARYKKWEQSRDKASPRKTALVPAYLRGGAGLFYTGEF